MCDALLVARALDKQGCVGPGGTGTLCPPNPGLTPLVLAPGSLHRPQQPTHPAYPQHPHLLPPRRLASVSSIGACPQPMWEFLGRGPSRLREESNSQTVSVADATADSSTGSRASLPGGGVHIIK